MVVPMLVLTSQQAAEQVCSVVIKDAFGSQDFNSKLAQLFVFP